MAQHLRDTFLGRATHTHAVESLDYILTKLHLYDTITDMQSQVLHNFAVELLATMGVVNDKNRMTILKTLLNLPMPPLLDEAKRTE